MNARRRSLHFNHDLLPALPQIVADSRSLPKTHVLYQGTTLEAAGKLKESPKGRLNLAQDAILGRLMEDE